MGGLIGRGSATTLRIQDARVSEVHAMVSLRGRELRLLALRGRLSVDDHEEDEVTLVVGQRVVFGGAVGGVVEELILPGTVLGLEFAGQVRELCAEAYSFTTDPTPDLVPRFLPHAIAHLWAADEGWLLQVGTDAPQPIRPGETHVVGGVTLVARSLSLSDTALAATIAARESLRLVCRTTTVHIHRSRREVATIDARAGQLLSELALMAAPVEWLTAAGLLWPKETDVRRLRRNFDAVLARLRTHLREAGVREDLVRTDGRGNVEVFLDRTDEVVDEA